MSLADRLKMFEQAAGGGGGGSRRNFTVPSISAVRREEIATGGAPPPKRVGAWGSRAPSFLETVQRVQANDPALTVVDLSNSAAMQCKVSEYTAQLCEALKVNTNVKELRLENCGIGDRECEVIATALKVNSAIAFLDLQKNRVNNEGASSIARGLATNTSVIQVQLIALRPWADVARAATAFIAELRFPTAH